MRRRLIVAVWLLGTLAATLLASAAVRQVTDEVGPRGPLPLPDAALAAGADADTTPASPSERTPAPTTTTRPTATARPAGEPGRGKTQPPATGTAPSAPDEQEQEEPKQEEPAAAPARTESYRVVGGVVTVRYSGDQTRLVQASPATGFSAEVNSSGPSTVDVRFRSDEHESRVRAELRNGRPDVRREEQER